MQVTLKSATSAISFGQTDTTDVGAITRAHWIAPFSYAAPAMAIAVLVLPQPIPLLLEKKPESFMYRFLFFFCHLDHPSFFCHLPVKFQMVTMVHYL